MYPNVSQPTVTVNVNYNGASPTVMRDSIIRPIEDQIAGAAEPADARTRRRRAARDRSPRSSRSTRTSTPTWSTSRRRCRSPARRCRATLPAPTVAVRDPSESIVVTLSLTSTQLTLEPALARSRTAASSPTSSRVPGVSNVTPGGSVTPAYEVTVNPRKLDAYGLTLSDVINTISHEQRPRAGRHRVRAEPRNEHRHPRRHRHARSRSSGSRSPRRATAGDAPPRPARTAPRPASAGRGRPVDDGQRGPAHRRRRDGRARATSRAASTPRSTGSPGVFLQIQKTSDASEVDASNNVLAALPRIKAAVPRDQLQRRQRPVAVQPNSSSTASCARCSRASRSPGS